MITINIAGIPVGIDNRFSHIANMAKDYLTDETPFFTVSVTDAEIEEEKSFSETSYSDAYYEGIVAYRHIAERLPDYDAFVFHGAVVEVGEFAYLVTAHSGVGKTTHLSLWLSEFSDAEILNGDKPIIRFIDGIAYACGTPWQGKENYGKNSTRKLQAIAFLQRGAVNEAYEINYNEAALDFMSQVYLPKKNRLSLSKTMFLSDKLIRSMRLVRLRCNMDKSAAHVSRKALVDSIYTRKGD
jgi:hypothetical protein